MNSLPEIHQIDGQESMETSFINSHSKNKDKHNIPPFESIQELLPSKEKVSSQKIVSRNELPIYSNPMVRTNQYIQQQPSAIFQSHRLMVSPPKNQIPPPKVWRERRPYDRQVIAYEPRMMYVPVQKTERAWYEVEHIVEYVQREVTEMVPSVEPRQVVRYKLQYVPVEKKIIHMPQSLVGKQQFKNIPNGKDERAISNQQDYFNEEVCLARNRPKYVSQLNYDSTIRARQTDDLISQMQQLRERQKCLSTQSNFQ